MRKTLHKSILFVALLAINVYVFSAKVNLAIAQTAAINFFKVTSHDLGDRVTITASLKFTQTEADGTVDFYVFDISPVKGYVIISAEDQTTPVLAYSLESNFNPDFKGQALQSWMNHAGAHIYKAIQRHVVANARISGQWTAYLQGQRPSSPKSAGVPPLLTTRWDQEPFYNKLCPYNNTDHMRAVTGCVATAMAQIMKFWNYPAQGTGVYGYNDAPPSYVFNYGNQFANFGNTTYNWADMPNSLSADNASVATLMYQCGVAVSMGYGDDNQGGSGAYVLRSDVASWRHSAEMAYATYFSYNPNTLKGVHAADYNSADWVNLMESELNAGRPIQYAGTDPNEGSHTWVCDGYDANDMLHMNWGWGGMCNGYFNVASLTADGFNFSTSEEALLGIEPMSAFTINATATHASICAGGKTTLSAGGPAAASYSWTPATGLSCATCSTTIATPTTTTIYTLTADSAGFSATSQVTVAIGSNTMTINRVNIANVLNYGAGNGNAKVEVRGGTPAYSYAWSNHQATDSVSNLVPGRYMVTVSDAGGCSVTAEANITQPDSATVSTPSSHTEHAPEGPASGHSAESPNSGAAFSNKGGVIYIQKSALVEIQGDFINTMSDSTGTIKNDGIIELSGNFQNDSGAVFTTGSNSGSTDRAVKFIGSGKQLITGAMSTTGKASFYNLVIDQAAASDTVEMQTAVAVQGSIVFGTASFTTTYNPSSLYTNNNQKGLFKTFQTPASEYLLDIQNGNADAIAGYPVLEIGGSPNTGFILTSGARRRSTGGVQRAISSATSYLFPVGTTDKGFNGARLNFTQIPGNGSVKSKFCSGSSNSSGHVGKLSTHCANCTPEYPAPSDSGYNRYFLSNECNNGAPQWLILENTSLNHGYWSFASTNTGYKYDMEVFPNGFAQEDASGAWRVIKHEALFGADPSGATIDWTGEIESSVSGINDLLTYTKNIVCYSGVGVPGGNYTDFSHFTMGMSSPSHALPVQLLYITAQGTGKHHIKVSWATALEINNSGFFVMRSTDGVNFADVGWVQGHDNSTVNQTYAFDDRTPQNTLYYYKLRQVDNNGKFSYSNIVNAQLADQQSNDFALYPNPTSSEIFLDIKNPSEEVKVDMYDMRGQTVYNNIFTVGQSGADQTLTINASSMLPPGTYILKASTNGAQYSSKVILQ